MKRRLQRLDFAEYRDESDEIPYLSPKITTTSQPLNLESDKHREDNGHDCNRNDAERWLNLLAFSSKCKVCKEQMCKPDWKCHHRFNMLTSGLHLNIQIHKGHYRR
jgi:hypothetical protein